eukprot:GHVS01013388.1.p1 GENE.GHVS01013388.1~~GHVS01013388.1.p1  ORF type:complete len:782 (+),score=166.15 GHVS01013388.1:224-2569(+)
MKLIGVWKTLRKSAIVCGNRPAQSVQENLQEREGGREELKMDRNEEEEIENDWKLVKGRNKKKSEKHDGTARATASRELQEQLDLLAHQSEDLPILGGGCDTVRQIPGLMYVEGSGSRRRRKYNRRGHEPFICGACTFSNLIPAIVVASKVSLSCKVCGTRLGEDERRRDKEPAVEQKAAEWECGACTYRNEIDRSECGVCGNRRGQSVIEKLEEKGGGREELKIDRNGEERIETSKEQEEEQECGGVCGNRAEQYVQENLEETGGGREALKMDRNEEEQIEKGEKEEQECGGVCGNRAEQYVQENLEETGGGREALKMDRNEEEQIEKGEKEEEDGKMAGSIDPSTSSLAEVLVECSHCTYMNTVTIKDDINDKKDLEHCEMCSTILQRVSSTPSSRRTTAHSIPPNCQLTSLTRSPSSSLDLLTPPSFPPPLLISIPAVTCSVEYLESLVPPSSPAPTRSAAMGGGQRWTQQRTAREATSSLEATPNLEATSSLEATPSLATTSSLVDNQSSGNENQSSGKDSQSSGKDNQSSGKDNQSSGKDKQSSGKDNQSSGKGNQSSGKDNQSSGKDNQSSGDTRSDTRDHEGWCRRKDGNRTRGTIQKAKYREGKDRQFLRAMRMLVLMGLPASGKSTLSTQLSRRFCCQIVCQDDLGSILKCRQKACHVLSGKKCPVVVDRCNVEKAERHRWIVLATAMGVPPSQVGLIFLDIPSAQCRERIERRKGHPTIPAGPMGEEAITAFESRLEHPQEQVEQFGRIWTIESSAQLESFLKLYSSCYRR